ncbi:hypothetical protein [Amycolatopsis sp. DG1A-15b]|uniref:hypothetical protein n=1 Tax=Amycolatopsis sp. DG1A-15b TaxID=3052846 RepID=UPI00255B557B|nr:hypothetical protein [Amycolatopsis sp. DG1A-15b]WIX91487.1 hypothetical protein QRY02_14060 [Amycolatopsis sp. DG1A-15b]
MTVRWVENARGGGTPDDRVRSARAALARADAPAARPTGTARRPTDERERR